MTSPSYNIYVRFQDKSSERGWSQIWVDGYPSFGEARMAMESFDQEKLDDGRLIALSVNKDGAAYGKNEITMVLGKSVNGKLCFVCDNYYVGSQDWVPVLSPGSTSYEWWNNNTNPIYLEEAITYSIAYNRILNMKRILLSCKINKDILGLISERLMPIDEYAKKCLHSLDAQIESIENEHTINITLNNGRQPDSRINVENEIYEALKHSQVDVGLSVKAALSAYFSLQYFFKDIPDMRSWLISTMKRHVTLCMVIEDMAGLWV